jgi:hypothetical protein
VFRFNRRNAGNRRLLFESLLPGCLRSPPIYRVLVAPVASPQQLAVA